MAKQGISDDNPATVSHASDTRAPLDTASPEETRKVGKWRICGDPKAMHGPDSAESQPKLFDGDEPEAAAT
jgi:hypothetical protein